MRYKRYKNELDYSYALGMAPVIELIKCRPGCVLAVFVHPDYKAGAGADLNIFELCRECGLPCETNQKIFNIEAQKENIYVIGVFKKFNAPLSPLHPHAVFVNPGDAGNLGANLRTCLGFCIRDIAIIKPGADIYSPKTVRASMGAVFHVSTAGFSSYDEYAAAFPEHSKFLFMLSGATELGEISAIDDDRISLVFGNEATGLPDSYMRYGRSVRIPHSGAIDSLNLTVAVGVAAHKFYNLRFIKRLQNDKQHT